MLTENRVVLVWTFWRSSHGCHSTVPFCPCALHTPLWRRGALRLSIMSYGFHSHTSPRCAGWTIFLSGGGCVSLAEGCATPFMMTFCSRKALRVYSSPTWGDFFICFKVTALNKSVLCGRRLSQSYCYQCGCLHKATVLFSIVIVVGTQRNAFLKPRRTSFSIWLSSQILIVDCFFVTKRQPYTIEV